MSIAVVIIASRPGERIVFLLLVVVFGDGGSIQVVRSAALSGLDRLDSFFVLGIRLPFGSLERFLVAGRSLQFMTLHSCLAFILVMAFLVASVALFHSSVTFGAIDLTSKSMFRSEDTMGDPDLLRNVRANS